MIFTNAFMHILYIFLSCSRMWNKNNDLKPPGIPGMLKLRLFALSLWVVQVLFEICVY